MCHRPWLWCPVDGNVHRAIVFGMDLLRKLMGAGMLVISALGFIGVVTNPPPEPGGAAFVLALITIGGVAVLWPRKKALPTPSTVDAEQVVLEAARANRGRVTAIEVATDGRLSHAEAESVLERLDRAGACRSLIAESGIMVYYFPEFENASAKSDVFFGEEEEALRRRAAQVTEKN